MEKNYYISLKRMKEYKDVYWDKGTYAGTKEDSTIGELKVIDKTTNDVIFKCFTVENGGPSTDESGKDKRIVARKYDLEWAQPTRVSVPKDWNKAPWLSTKEFSGFRNRGILIHIGNSPQDSRGCILLNNVDNKNGTGAGSAAACLKFFSLLEEKGIENFELEVFEISKDS